MALVTEANRKWWALGALSVSLFMIMLDNTVVSLALPSIQKDLGTSLSQLEWVVNAYALVFAVLLLTAGKLADFLGRRKIFLGGIVVFTLTSLACALASNGGALIGARSVQGVGAAMMLPATLSIISAVFPVAERGMAIGIWAGVSGGALAIGPLVGGVLVEYASWQWIFYINLPVGVLGVFLAFWLVPESRDMSGEQKLDIPGLIASGATIFLLSFGLIEANSYGWTSATIILCFVGAAVSLALFVAIEMRQRLPMIDLSLFRNPTFSAGNAGGVLMFVSLFGFVFFISIYFQTVLGYSVIRAGASFLVVTMAIMLTSPIAGVLSDRYGSRWLMAGGMFLWGVGITVLSTIVDVNTGFLKMTPWFILGGIGFGLVMPPMTAAILGSIDVDKSGVASGVMQAFRQLGGGLGVAVMGAIITRHVGDLSPGDPRFVKPFVSGFQDVLLTGGLVGLASAVVAVVFVRTHIEHRAPDAAVVGRGGGAE
jgi:EmrB/QacA subfamily drug resistance transporter